MPTLTLAELLVPETEDSLYATFLGVLAGGGMPATAWGKTSVPLNLAKAASRADAKAAAQIPTIVKGGLLRYVTDSDVDPSWADLLIESNFGGLERSPATSTERWLRLTDTGGVGPVDINAGEHTIIGDGALRYVAITNGKVPASGFVDVLFRADRTGEGWAGVVSSWAWETSVPGVSIADAPAGVSKAGTDKESTADYVQRARDQWSALGAGANDAAYRFLVQQALVGTADEGRITRVKVREAYPLPGQVTIYVADDSATGVDGADVVSNIDVASAVTQTGSGPAMTIGGIPLESYSVLVEILTGGVLGVGTFRVSRDGGSTWSTTQTLAASYVLAGTGITLTFAAGTYVAKTSYAFSTTLSIVSRLQAYLDPPSHLGKAPNCVDVFVVSAKFKAISLVGTVTAVSTERVAAQAAANAALSALAASTVIGGGTTAKISREKIIEKIMRQLTDDDRNDLSLTTPAADVSLSADQVPVFDVSGLTWTDA